MTEPKAETETIEVPAALAAPLREFLHNWTRLPPLVRAAFGAAWAFSLYRSWLRRNEEARREETLCGLLRRAEVTRRFGEAERALEGLLAAFARAADDEAAALGIVVHAAGPDDLAPATAEPAEPSA